MLWQVHRFPFETGLDLTEHVVGLTCMKALTEGRTRQQRRMQRRPVCVRAPAGSYLYLQKSP